MFLRAYHRLIMKTHEATLIVMFSTSKPDRIFKGKAEMSSAWRNEFLVARGDDFRARGMAKPAMASGGEPVRA